MEADMFHLPHELEKYLMYQNFLNSFFILLVLWDHHFVSEKKELEL